MTLSIYTRVRCGIDMLSARQLFKLRRFAGLIGT
jgi:hypothetical protein